MNALNIGIFLWMSGKNRVRNHFAKKERRSIKLVAVIRNVLQDPRSKFQYVEFVSNRKVLYGRFSNGDLIVGMCVDLNGYWKQYPNRSIHFEIVSWKPHWRMS